MGTIFHVSIDVTLVRTGSRLDLLHKKARLTISPVITSESESEFFGLNWDAAKYSEQVKLEFRQHFDWSLPQEMYSWPGETAFRITLMDLDNVLLEQKFIRFTNPGECISFSSWWCVCKLAHVHLCAWEVGTGGQGEVGGGGGQWGKEVESLRRW